MLVGLAVAGASFTVAALCHALPWERWPWWTALAVAVLVLPLRTHHDDGEVWSALAVIAVCVVVGELLAHHLSRLEEARSSPSTAPRSLPPPRPRHDS